MNYPPYVPVNSLHHLLGTDLNFLYWQKWFAWYPIKLQSGNRTFMRTVYRRKKTIEFTRLPIESLGMFRNRLTLSDMIYSDGTEVAIEKLAGKDSYVDEVKSIMFSCKEGTYSLDTK